jgi:hypothetical protein
MLDLKEFLPPGTRTIVKDDHLIISQSGMRKLKIRCFIHDEDLPSFFFGLGLFAGEGRQRFTDTTERIEFINSRPPYVKLFQKFLQILNLDSLIKPRIQLKSNLDYESALNFWSRTLNIPHESFSRPLIFPKKPRKASKSRISPFGSLVIRVSSALAFRLMKYWIQIFLVQKVVGPKGFEPLTNRSLF